MEKFNIMLVGDSEIRERARVALASAHQVEIAGELATFEERHLKFVEEIAPKVVVVDGNARDFDSRAAVSMIGRCDSVKSVIVIGQIGWASPLSFCAEAVAVVSTRKELLKAIAPSVRQLHVQITTGRAA